MASGNPFLAALLETARVRDAPAALEVLSKAGVESLDDFPSQEAKLRDFLKDCGLTLVNVSKIGDTITGVRDGKITVRSPILPKRLDPFTGRVKCRWVFSL